MYSINAEASLLADTVLSPSCGGSKQSQFIESFISWYHTWVILEDDRSVKEYRAHLLALALYALLALVLTWPLVLHLTTHIPGSEVWAFGHGSEYLVSQYLFEKQPDGT